MRKYFFVLLACWSVVLMGCDTSSTPSTADKPVQIRVRNDTGFPVSEVWIGSTSVDGEPMVGPVAVGATSGYQPYGTPLPRYRQVHIVLENGKRYLGVVDPEAQFGARDLAPGKYTFVLTIVGDPVPIEIIKD